MSAPLPMISLALLAVPFLPTYMFRVLPSATVMPFSAVSVAPSQRIRFTVPVTVTRSLMITLFFTAYQPEDQVYTFSSMDFTSVLVNRLNTFPCASLYAY